MSHERGRRPCAGQTAAGRPCRAQPLTGGQYCFLHDPASSEEAANARRLGGLRRRRERVVETTFDLPPDLSVSLLQRVLTIALVDTLALENGIARNRTLVLAVRAGAELVRASELAERLRTIELAILGRTGGGSPALVLAADPDPDDDAD
jgi:hypothetical protein